MTDQRAEEAGAQGRDEDRARELLLEEAERRGSLGAIDLEALCRVHPTLEPALRSIHAGCAQLEGLLGALRDAPAQALPPEEDAAVELLERMSARGGAIERYELRGERGRGAMGTVLLAWDGDLRRLVAMKLARPVTPAGPARAGSGRGSGLDSRRLGRFLDEAQIMSQLTHPGVVSVHELGLDAQGRVYFTMPLVEGEDLREVLRRTHAGEPEWSPTRVLGVLLKVCETLAYAHEKGVVHRDVKPANIMVGPFGEVYVMDWGLARVLARPVGGSGTARGGASVSTVRGEAASDDDGSPLSSREGDVVGTPPYMPPEQARGELRRLDPRADVYAVGAILYHLLTGSAPYTRRERGPRSAHEILAAVLAGPPAPLGRDVPPELAAICERAMAREPEERYPGCSELAADLRAYLEDRVVSAHRTGPLVELRKWVRRNRAVAALGAATVVLAIGGSALVAWRESVRKRELGDANVTLARERDEKQRLAESNRALADVMSAQVLLDEHGTHEPDPAGIARLARWVERAGELVERRPRYVGARAEELGGAVTAAELAQLLEHVDALERALPVARERLARLVELPRRTLEEPAARWREAADSVGSDPRFEGLQLEPQLGLVPLDRDPDSGLWEFWHVLSGERPAREAGAGAPGEEAGIVLVLVPGGTYVMGSPPDEPRRDWNETAHEVSVAPFLLSKHETTQAQWRRLAGTTPSFYPAGTVYMGIEIGWTHPVESISWLEAERAGRLAGLRLPTEEEWEYACRAGSDARFHWGPELEHLEGLTNVGDQSLVEHVAGDVDEWFEPAPWADGFPFTSPVGSFPANAFGLHDLHGNVGEWTASRYLGGYVPGLGERPEPQAHDRVARGGNALWGPAFARAALRQPLRPENANRTLGARFARDLRAAR